MTEKFENSTDSEGSDYQCRRSHINIRIIGEHYSDTRPQNYEGVENIPIVFEKAFVKSY